jgi:CdiI immunity protein
MLREQFPDLYQFFAGRFNQDWDLFAPDDGGVIEGFLREEPPEFVNAVRREISALIGLGLPEHVLQQAVWRDLGCSYDPTPDGVSMTQWIQSVSERLDRDPPRPPE